MGFRRCDVNGQGVFDLREGSHYGGIGQEQAAGVKETVSPPKERMSYEEFLEWCDEDIWAEWVDGEVIVLSPANDRHRT